jgi:hypothetical protein
MSQWTHIRGGLELVSTPYEMKKMPKSLVEPKKEDFETEEAFEKAHDKYRWEIRKLLYYPYPEAQFKLLMPEPGISYGKKKKNGKREEFHTIDFKAKVYSLPRARKYIEEAFKLMPQGEVGFRYSLDQNDKDSSSSCSGFMVPCDYKAYQDALNRLYKAQNPFDSYTYEDLRRWFHIDEECSVDEVSHIIVGIRDDIRHASAEEVQEGLEKAFKYLEDHEISVEDGYLEWQDEYEPDYIYAWRFSRLSWGISHQFLKLAKRTNQVVHSKTWAAKRDENGKRMYDEKWNPIWEVVEKDGSFTDEEDFE